MSSRFCLNDVPEACFWYMSEELALWVCLGGGLFEYVRGACFLGV